MVAVEHRCEQSAIDNIFRCVDLVSVLMKSDRSSSIDGCRRKAIPRDSLGTSGRLAVPHSPNIQISGAGRQRNWAYAEVSEFLGHSRRFPRYASS
jgi:hypothetical protein